MLSCLRQRRGDLIGPVPRFRAVELPHDAAVPQVVQACCRSVTLLISGEPGARVGASEIVADGVARLPHHRLAHRRLEAAALEVPSAVQAQPNTSCNCSCASCCGSSRGVSHAVAWVSPPHAYTSMGSFADRAPRSPMPPDVIAVPLRPRPEARVAGQLRGHMDVGPLPTGFAPEPLVLYSKVLGIRKGYKSLRSEEINSFICTGTRRAAWEHLSTLHFPIAAVLKWPALQLLAPDGLSQKKLRAHAHAHAIARV